MDGMPKQIWANAAVFGNGEPLAGEWNYRDVGSPDDTLYVRADLAQAPAPVRVKPLAWDRYDNTNGYGCKYMIYEGGQGWNAVIYPIDARHYQLVTGVTKADAIKACDDNHAARILAALEAPDAGLVAELVEIATDAVNHMGPSGKAAELEIRLAALLAKLGVQ